MRHRTLQDAVFVRGLGLEHDAAAAVDRTLEIRLRLLGENRLERPAAARILMPAGNDLDRLRRFVNLRVTDRPVIFARGEDLRLEALAERVADAPLRLARWALGLLGVEKLQRLFIRCGIQLARPPVSDSAAAGCPC